MNQKKSSKAVILVSGGLDSATVLALAKDAGFDLYAISFDYGQRHQFELQAAENVCNSIGVKKQITFKLDLRAFGGSALTDEIDVPKDRDNSEMESDIPITYVPARNTIFLSIAMGWAETLGTEDIFLGVNAVDYSGYPDCRPEFIKAFQNVANLATRSGIEGNDKWKIHTPLISLSKSEIIQKGLSLGVNYGLTHSCYDPDSQGVSCGRCDSCKLRLKGFEEANAQDPIKYQ
jgi:7-cyano-7-deazaguanine synthase